MGLGRMPQTQVLSVSTIIAPATNKRSYPLSLILCQLFLSQSSRGTIALPSSALVPLCSAAKRRRQVLNGGICRGDGAPPPTRPSLCYSLAA